MDRRAFLARLGLAAGISAFGLPSPSKADSDIGYNPTVPQNILLIVVDELRYLELYQRTMGLAGVLPNITLLQSQSVEFTNNFAAGTSCTPARAALVTGLYPTQTCMYITQSAGATPSLIPTFTANGNPPPAYNYTGFPTFGSYLTAKGYNCLWFGKWHLSDESPDYNRNYLATYGFDYTTTPSPNGFPNEGNDGGPGQADNSGPGNYQSDQNIVVDFAQNAPGYFTQTNPWCMVVSLINPHDISNYPNYMLNYCNYAGQNGELPNFYPVQPNTGIYPKLTPLYNTTAPAAPACSGLYQGWYIPGNVIGALGTPANVSQDPTAKPPLQTTYRNDLQSANGIVGTTPNMKNPNGDWGAFLNVYYWLASCADALIGNLNTPDPANTTTPTILGQVAYQAAQNNVDLSKTIIVFTSDHGEYGGAHLLQGKGAASYDEAIHVPLFVRLPGYATMNRQRTQMVSSVDFFGLMAALGTNNALAPGTQTPQWRVDNPQLSARQDMYSFLLSNSNPSTRTLTSQDQSLSGQPYIMHTTNEYYANKQAPQPYQEACHVVALRTPTQKFVYYYTWATPASPLTADQFQFDNSVSAVPDAAHSEYYNLTSDPGEQNNMSSSISPGAQATFLGVIGSELQAQVGPVNGVNLTTLRNTAGGSYVNYITPPIGVSVSPLSFVHDTQNPIVFTITATGGVSAGPSAKVLQVIGANLNLLGTFYLDDTEPVPPTPSNPFTFSQLISVPGTYYVQLINTSSSYVQVTVTAS